MYKVVIVGNSGTGKTCILNRYVHCKFADNVPTTIGIEFVHKEYDDETNLVLWDTAGQERFKSVTSSLYRGAHAIIFVYDVTNRDSFYGLDQWMREYTALGNVDKSVAMLLGNKIDLDHRAVSKDEALGWAAKNNMCYEEVSAWTGDNVREAFATVVRRLHTLPEVRDNKQRIKESLSKSDRCCY